MNEKKKDQIERINKIPIEIEKIRIDYIKLLDLTTHALDSKMIKLSAIIAKILKDFKELIPFGTMIFLKEIQ